MDLQQAQFRRIEHRVIQQLRQRRRWRCARRVGRRRSGEFGKCPPGLVRAAAREKIEQVAGQRAHQVEQTDPPLALEFELFQGPPETGIDAEAGVCPVEAGRAASRPR